MTEQRIKIVTSLAEPVGQLWRNLQGQYTRSGNFYVAAPLSSTPLPIYDWIISNKDSFPKWEKVRFVLMDEQVEGSKSPFRYIPTEDPASYERFAQNHLLKPLDKGVVLIKPEFDQLQDFTPPIDLLILALGVRGNYANVMPGTSLETGWHIAHLIPEFRQAHTAKGSASYAGAAFREYGMSLGPQQVLQAKHIAVIISGQSKRDLTTQLINYVDFDPEFPLSIVYHPSVRSRVQFYITDDARANKS